ncbi:MAG TPA: DUF4276 family protein [Thermoanaerobaculia bacterium]|nr:DUF4276 family protein [Thermoanaerobaculia bacterium]
MRIGILVDGQGEYYALPHLLPRLGSPNTILRPLFSAIQPLARPDQIAYVASKSFPILLNQGADLILILIDKETRQECTGPLVEEIERAARSRLQSLSKTADVQVVLKVTKLENWLVADPQALRDLPGLFEHVERIEKQVVPGRADTVDAHELLKVCSHKRSYDKKAGAIKICGKLDPERARKNSRSFRKLLKTLGCPEPPVKAARGQARRR